MQETGDNVIYDLRFAIYDLRLFFVPLRLCGPKIFKNAQKLTKSFKNSRKPSKTVSEFAIRWFHLKKQRNVLISGSEKII